MEVASGDNWSYKSCKAPVKSSPPTNQHPVWHLTNPLSPTTQLKTTMSLTGPKLRMTEVVASQERPNVLPVTQPTVTKHWSETCLKRLRHEMDYLCWKCLTTTQPVTTDTTLCSFKRHLKAHLFQQYSTLLLAGGLSAVRPAPLWLFSEFGAIYKYSDLLTYRAPAGRQSSPKPFCAMSVYHAGFDRCPTHCVNTAYIFTCTFPVGPHASWLIESVILSLSPFFYVSLGSWVISLTVLGASAS